MKRKNLSQLLLLLLCSVEQITFLVQACCTFYITHQITHTCPQRRDGVASNTFTLCEHRHMSNMMNHEVFDITLVSFAANA